MGGKYFKHFHQRGAIIQGRQSIEGRLLFEEIWYLVFFVTLIMASEQVVWYTFYL